MPTDPSNVLLQVDLVVSLCKVASIKGEPKVNLGWADAILKRLYGEEIPTVDKRGWMDYAASALEKAEGV